MNKRYVCKGFTWNIISRNAIQLSLYHVISTSIHYILIFIESIIKIDSSYLDSIFCKSFYTDMAMSL